MVQSPETAQRIRDLRGQIAELSNEDESDILFQEISPRRKKVTIYSMTDGEPISIPAYMAEPALNKARPGGGFMFTADPADAPEYKMGNVKCFLHPESPYRASGVLEEAGIAAKVCHSGHLASKFAMEEVARSKHRKEWAALEAYLAEQKEAQIEERQVRQLEATLALAGKAAGQEETAFCEVEGCEFSGTKRQLQGHRMGAHK